MEIYRCVQSYARDLADWGGYSVTQARDFRYGQNVLVWYVRPEENEDKMAQIAKSLRDGECEPMIAYDVQDD